MPKVLSKIFKKKIAKTSKKKVLSDIKPRKILKIGTKEKKVVPKPKKVVSKKDTKQDHQLERFVGNPVIYPAGNTYWESRATFNPTAFIHDGKVHVIYRAVGESDISTLGYGRSTDGYNTTDRNFKPVFFHKNYFTDYENSQIHSSGGGWNGGAEDPRITKIGDMLYMTYTAFDGWGSVRIGLTSISL